MEDGNLEGKEKVIQEGKLSITQLKELIFQYTEQYSPRREEVLRSPYIGEDCAVLDTKGRLVALSADPITAATKNIGRLSVIINLNDVASAGAEPLGIMVTLLCPIGTTEEEVAVIMEDIAKASLENRVEILGGHTEITSAVSRIVLSITAIGLLEQEDLQIASSEEEYDIYMTKDVALEGIYIIAAEHEEELCGILTEEEKEQICAYEKQLSVVEDAKTAKRYHPRIMHDVTEGGVLGALWEICESVSLGAVIDYESMYLPDFTKKIASYYGIDPLRLISSGCLMFLLEKRHREEVKEAFEHSGIRLSRIGYTTSEREVKMKKDGKWISVDPPSSDELYKI